jgi:hypothetical protein
VEVYRQKREEVNAVKEELKEITDRRKEEEALEMKQKKYLNFGVR